MPLLQARVRQRAEALGVDFLEHTEATELDQVSGRLKTTGGAVVARHVVDATGLRGCGLVTAPRIPREDLCAAVQETRRCIDPAAAQAFFDAHGAQPGDVLCFTGIAGGYAILNVRRHGDDEVAILTGSIPGGGHPSGRVLLDRFVEAHPWIGETTAGGGRAIPVGTPQQTLHHGRVLRFGDAAGMVYASHGSGVAAQLTGSALLAEVLASGGTAADWTTAWHRDHGAELAASDVFSRFSRTITPEFLGGLLDAGVLSEGMVVSGLLQHPPSPTPGELVRVVRAFPGRPRALGRLLPVLARMQALRTLHRAHPGAPRPRDVGPALGGAGGLSLARVARERSMGSLLHYREDRRTIVFVLVAISLQVAGVVFFDQLPWWVLVPYVAFTAWMSWLCAVITHNTVHHPIFRSRTLNKLFQHVLTVSYGSPVSAFVPGHNLSHHLYTQTRRDVMRTTKLRSRFHLVNQLTGPLVLGYDIQSADVRYAMAMRTERPAWFRQWVAEWVVSIAARVALFVVNPWGFLCCVFVPHLAAAAGIIGINYIQHDGMDRESTYNHSRNLTGPLLNWWAFNNGFHTIHHMKPGLHWTKLREAHAAEVAPFAHPGTEETSFPGYLWRAYFWPAGRRDYLGRIFTPEPAGADESWIPGRNDTPKGVSLGAEG